MKLAVQLIDRANLVHCGQGEVERYKCWCCEVLEVRGGGVTELLLREAGATGPV
jgi:hypothetical protein